MAFDEQFFKEWGAMQQSIKTIEERTEKIEKLGERVIILETTTKDMKPKVEAHEKTHQRSIGVAVLASVVLTAIKEFFIAVASGGGGAPGGHP